ncbi:hypothetical protein GAQ44_07445 [Bacteroides uniformis]|uniref:Uncharacterized protein n=1 Tax=Bacteroides uniformis TaxID=820 RepID=A0A7J5H4E0_BACUN|nr:hypothetical protein [Bacteroides uniformis]KAB4184859.1 hypothetical protein GAQ44_07445 [Bacteroides uniformis]
MEITKTMKSFNVEQYNDEINKLNKMIKTINDLNYLFICWGAEEEMPKEWFESLLTLPFAEIRKRLNPMYMVDSLRHSYSVYFEYDTTNLSCYIDYLDELSDAMKTQMEFLKLLPEIQKGYGSLFIYNEEQKECQITKDAERLIMEQCIEWKED